MGMWHRSKEQSPLGAEDYATGSNNEADVALPREEDKFKGRQKKEADLKVPGMSPWGSICLCLKDLNWPLGEMTKQLSGKYWENKCCCFLPL